MSDLEDTIKEEMQEKQGIIAKVLDRFEFLGYSVNEDKAAAIAFYIKKVQNNIKNFCNISHIPNKLDEIIADRVCGEFLLDMKNTGQLSDDFDLDTAIKQVQAGDTNVTFAIGEGSETTESRLNSLIEVLRNSGESDLLCYRQLKW